MSTGSSVNSASACSDARLPHEPQGGGASIAYRVMAAMIALGVDTAKRSPVAAHQDSQTMLMQPLRIDGICGLS
ncbi:hypothetical protein [Microbacterium pygmaeum]|uniref:Uncharacterized protein n=1 Tax=Microbacterium pygmaeum TaxID=370764 RepID=A0A1G7V5B3_9MICO|nr:hypothetical protein [Microbacterium pygmaeum]SDG54917.1 hypothetical protein SAMN04489810_0602 [Microbacterium pygmaeum]